MKYSDKDFKKADEDTKEKIIEMVCNFFTHNFISKDALVEIIRYQDKKIRDLGGKNDELTIDRWENEN